MNWRFNEWDRDARWDDTERAKIEALRAIAEQLERLADSTDSKELQEIWRVKE